MRRLNSERGATAVVVGITMVVLLGFAALSVDVGAMWWDKQRLQNGADAAALAIANDCAHGTCPAAANQSTARRLADGNFGEASPRIVDIDLGSPQRVTVTLANERSHWLAPVIGVDSTDVAASASAVWGPIGGATTIPIIFSLCEFERTVLDDPTNITMLGKSKDGVEGCIPRGAPHHIPGGFGWLITDTVDGCSASIGAGNWVTSSTGNTTPNGCSDALLKDLLKPGNEVLVPLFDESDDTGANGRYHVISFAAIRIGAFCLTNKVQGGLLKSEKCTGSERWIRASFVRYVAVDAVSTGTGTDTYGATTVVLDR